MSSYSFGSKDDVCFISCVGELIAMNMKAKLTDAHAQGLIHTIRVMKWVYLALSLGGVVLLFNDDSLVTKVFYSLLLLAGWGAMWYAYYRAKYDFEFFGVENIQLVGASLSDVWRDMVWERGYITLEQWNLACQSANVEAASYKRKRNRSITK